MFIYSSIKIKKKYITNFHNTANKIEIKLKVQICKIYFKYIREYEIRKDSNVNLFMPYSLTVLETIGIKLSNAILQQRVRSKFTGVKGS